MSEAKQYKQEFKDLCTDRSTWNNMFQIVGEYVSQAKQNFNAEQQPGDFLTDNIYDSKGTFAAQNSASALLGMLWPGSARKAIAIAPPDDMPMSTQLAAFYSMMTERTILAFDDPKAQLMLSLDEYMLDQLIFGTSGVGVETGYESKLLFRPYGVKESFIDEGKNGTVTKVFLMYEWRVGRVVDEYGIDNVSEKVRKKYQEGKFGEKIKILHVIQKRMKKKAQKGQLAMDYMSFHMEYDTEKTLLETGFQEKPIYFGRFRKLNYERYGRSPAMSALPDIREANVLREAIIRATEKMLDPPLGILDNGMLGGASVDTSAGAVNVFNAANNTGNKPPVFPIVTIGDMNVAIARLESLEQSIAQHFFIDRLLDFNSQNEMTLGEVQIRDQIRTASLSALFSRQLAEVFTPLFERAVNILWRAGEFGVLPDSEEEADVIKAGREPIYFPDEIIERLEQGLDVYKVVYKTKAASAVRAEEYMATLELLGQYRQDIQLNPAIKNRVNLHEAYKSMGQIRGIPIRIVREDDAVAELDKQDAQMQQQAMMLAAAEQVGNAADKFASANMKSKQAEKQ